VRAHPSPFQSPRPPSRWAPEPGRWARADGWLALILTPVPSGWDAILQDGRIGRFEASRVGPVLTPLPGEWWRLVPCLVHNPGHGWGALPVLVPRSSIWWTDPAREGMICCGCLAPDDSEHPQ
jgi:hypothetical protein